MISLDIYYDGYELHYVCAHNVSILHLWSNELLWGGGGRIKERKKERN